MKMKVKHAEVSARVIRIVKFWPLETCIQKTTITLSDQGREEYETQVLSRNQ